MPRPLVINHGNKGRTVPWWLLTSRCPGDELLASYRVLLTCNGCLNKNNKSHARLPAYWAGVTMSEPLLCDAYLRTLGPYLGTVWGPQVIIPANIR